ncbi:EamA/RhaT family transporter [Pseudomethylobacillus aquaticus]|uniref:EamA/RhaT family transporter n=1 Tax=Pseudomethylobacillus aquaticus TaxID=2676064 RepID=A0A3N0UU99_9PROT|nr:DMT family transporter [Pseudomethylobacillus aquaticus]ROH84072.1 EamA/RhaT family transporter [Pseudomethylobacillus aquaticus]
MELVLVGGRILFSSFSNVIQKQLAGFGLHPYLIVVGTYYGLALLALPWVFWLPAGDLAFTFWWNIALASLFDVGGWLLLVLSLSRTDLSIFGPLNAYKVVASMLLALVFLHEVPSLQGLAGVTIIVGGSFLLMPAAKAGTARWQLLWRDKGVQARFASILLFSIGTLFLKGALLASDALTTLIFWCLSGLPMLLLANAAFGQSTLKQGVQELQQHPGRVLVVGVTVFVMQYCTLVLLSQMLVAYALALFQMGMLLQVLLGYRIFREPHVIRRLLASLVMIAGSLLVLLT